ncbi:ribonuclease H [Sesbania bispinosa]|nr:ribonuclease H [Sesbania bispinosa]
MSVSPFSSTAAQPQPIPVKPPDGDKPPSFCDMVMAEFGSKTTPQENNKNTRDAQPDSIAAHGDWLIVTRKKRTPNLAKNGKPPPNKPTQNPQGNSLNSFKFTQGSLSKANLEKKAAPKFNETGQSSKIWSKKKKPRTTLPQIDITKLLENASKLLINMSDRGEKIIASNPFGSGSHTKTAIIPSNEARRLKSNLDVDHINQLDPKPPDSAHTPHKLLVHEANMESDERSEEDAVEQDQSQDDMEVGALGHAGKTYCRELVRKHNPSLIILLETHCPFSKVKNFWESLGYHSCAISEAIGHARGIWILSSEVEITIDIRDIHPQ